MGQKKPTEKEGSAGHAQGDADHFPGPLRVFGSEKDGLSDSGGTLSDPPPEMSRDEIYDHVTKLIDCVGLRPEHICRYPHEFSGG